MHRELEWRPGDRLMVPSGSRMAQNGVPGYSLMRDYFNQLFIIPRDFWPVLGDFS
jgi:hypothetical protein